MSKSDPAGTAGLTLSGFDLDMVRQWFNAVQDTAPRYLEQRDFELAARIYRGLSLPVPRSVERHLEDAISGK
jgi:hypothetical protein